MFPLVEKRRKRFRQMERRELRLRGMMEPGMSER